MKKVNIDEKKKSSMNWSYHKIYPIFGDPIKKHEATTEGGKTVKGAKF